MINIEEERKAFEIEWIKLGGDFKSFSIIDNMYVLIPSMASADDVIKEFAERAVNSAFALWLIQSRQKQVVIDDLNIQLKDAKATPEGFVLVMNDRLTKAVNKIEVLLEDNSLLALGELLSIQQDLSAIIEAQEQSHELD